MFNVYCMHMQTLRFNLTILEPGTDGQIADAKLFWFLYIKSLQRSFKLYCTLLVEVIGLMFSMYMYMYITVHAGSGLFQLLLHVYIYAL